MNINTNYWEDRYQNENYPWDIGTVSPPLKNYIDQLRDKSLSILIPGSGFGHEAIYLVKSGFKNVTCLDISRTALQRLQANCPELKCIEADFFEHGGQYDLILEQTFFCALDPKLRRNYVSKMQQLLNKNGKLVGLLFDMIKDDGPPYGGTKAEYLSYFKTDFEIEIMEKATNSFAKRNEFFIKLLRKA